MGSLPRTTRMAIAAGLLAAAFLADLGTGNEVSSSLFYIVPVTFAAWFVGRGSGDVAAIADDTTLLMLRRSHPARGRE